jgi:hypothetical protein
LKSPGARTAAAFTVIGLLFALLWWQREIFGMIAALGMGLVLLNFAVRRMSAVWRRLCTVLYRKLARVVRAAARVNAMNPGVELLQLFLVVGSILAVASAMVMKDPRLIGQFGTGVALVAVVASVIDIPLRLAAIMRLAWARSLGKLAVAGVGALAIVAATVMAKHMVHHFAHVDPKFLPDSQALAILVIVPTMYLLLAVYLLLAWSLMNLIFAFILWSVFVPLGTVLDRVRGSGRYIDTWYRIASGRRAPAGYRPPGFPWAAAKLALRHLSVIVAILYVQSRTLAFLDANNAAFDQYVVGTIVALDFKSDSGCKDLPDGARVAYLDRDQISVAVPTSSLTTWTFYRRACAAAGSTP